MSMDVLTAAYNVVTDYPGGAQALGPQMGKSPSTLSHELNRNYPGAKLGLLDAVKITVLTGDRRILDAFDEACKGPVRVDGLSGRDAFAAISRAASEFSDLLLVSSAAWVDGEITATELDKLERETGELIAACKYLMAMAREQHAMLAPHASGRA